MACCNDGRPKDFWASHEETPVTRKFYARHDTEITEKDKELAKRFGVELTDPSDICGKENAKGKDTDGNNTNTTDKSNNLKKISSKDFPSCCRDAKSKEFRPDYSVKPLTPKFYARHDVQISDKIKNKAVKFASELQKRITHDPRTIRFAPVTENQVYGWLENRNMPRNPNDSAQQYFPRNNDDELRLQAQIHLDSHREFSFVRK